MKKAILILLGLVFVFGLAGFSEADAVNICESDECDYNTTLDVINDSESDEIIEVALNESGEISNTSNTTDEAFRYEKVFDATFEKVKLGYGGARFFVTSIDGGVRGFVGVVAVVIGVLFLFLSSIVYGGMPGIMHFKRAAVFHKRAERAHLNGDYDKAKKFYNKSYSLRDKGEEIGRANKDGV